MERIISLRELIGASSLPREDEFSDNKDSTFELDLGTGDTKELHGRVTERATVAPNRMRSKDLIRRGEGGGSGEEGEERKAGNIPLNVDYSFLLLLF